MEDQGIYHTAQGHIAENAPLALASQAAAELGYTLTTAQAQELADALAGHAGPIAPVVADYCGALVYDLENEHPVHTWARWAADLANDQTPPCQGYSDYVADRHHQGTVTINFVRYSADVATHADLSAYYYTNSGQMKKHLSVEQFDAFVQSRIAEGRLVACAA